MSHTVRMYSRLYERRQTGRIFFVVLGEPRVCHVHVAQAGVYLERNF